MAIQLTPEDRALIEKDSDLSNREIALQVKNLTISFRTDNGKVQAVRGVSFDLYRRRIGIRKIRYLQSDYGHFVPERHHRGRLDSL